MTSTTKPALDALTDLVTTARIRSKFAQRNDRPHTAQALAGIALSLDAARTRLVQDGPDYLDAAWALVDAGRQIIAQHTIILDRAMAEAQRRRELTNA